jgi:hypothetical protein
MSRRPVLKDVLGHADRNGLYRLADDVGPADALPISGARLIGKTAMLGAISQALDFPDYFGANWDALEECLTDLSWLDGDVVLLIDQASVAEDKAPDDWGVCLDILADAAKFWSGQGRPFVVFLRDSHAALPVVQA